MKVLPTTLLLIILVCMLVLYFLFPISTIFPFPFNLIGVILIVGGVLLSIIAENQFKRVGTNVNTFAEPDILVSDGLFRISRNPMYLSFVVLLIGVWIFMGRLSPLLGVVGFFLITDLYYIRLEERAISAKFGDAYQKYISRVRRWI